MEGNSAQTAIVIADDDEAYTMTEEYATDDAYAMIEDYAMTDEAFAMADEAYALSNSIYAVTNGMTLELAEFLVEELKPVNLEDLGPEHPLCIICKAEVCTSEDGKPSHAPVKTPCGHFFGKKCIRLWVDHRSFYSDFKALLPRFIHTGCPTCQEVLNRNFKGESTQLVEQRLLIWDRAYSRAGILRSDYEDSTRKLLWAYVEGYREIDEDEPLDADLVLSSAEERFMTWIHCLKSHNLSPEQEYLRKQLERFAVEEGFPLLALYSDAYQSLGNNVDNQR